MQFLHNTFHIADADQSNVNCYIELGSNMSFPATKQIESTTHQARMYYTYFTMIISGSGKYVRLFSVSSIGELVSVNRNGNRTYPTEPVH